MADLTLKGRDMFAIMATVPGVSAGKPGPAPVAGKLDLSLAALVERAQGGEVAVRMTLTNASADSLAQLRQAGLTITRRKRSEVTGRIAVDKLAAVTQLAFVVRIAPL
jgi:hypothetical protein